MTGMLKLLTLPVKHENHIYAAVAPPFSEKFIGDWRIGEFSPNNIFSILKIRI